jgi:diguanylate cyclase (GGDEF)-like protein
MFKGFQDTQALPEEVTRRLESMLFSVPASTMVYLAGLTTMSVTLWWRSEDVAITVIAAFALVLNLIRVGVVAWFNRHYPDHLRGRPKVYWVIVLWIGCLYSLTMVALTVRAFMLGEMLSIAISLTVVAGYIAGVVIRASAVPQLAIPHLLLLFVPMIVASACSPDRGWLVEGFLLALFCVGCIELSKTVYQRMKAQLLAEHQLSVLARTDYLTGLPNRVRFDALGSVQLQAVRAGASNLVLALIDLDGFKNVNDLHGHAAGDELLKQVSQRIRSVLSSADLAARLGGDEFAILFGAGCDPQQARVTGDKLALLLKQPFELAGSVVRISGSVGLACFDGDDSFASIVARADQAMYRAKNAGRQGATPQPLDTLALKTSPGVVPAIAPDALSGFGTRFAAIS